jgi:hypothetical protein
MSKITDFLRKIGLLHVSKGDSEFDSREDLKKPEEQKPQEAPAQEAPAQEAPAQEAPAQEAPAQEVSGEQEMTGGDQDALDNK